MANDVLNAQRSIIYDLSGVSDPSVSGLDAFSGTTYKLLSDHPKIFLKMDDGFSTNWIDISSSISHVTNLGLGAQLVKNVGERKLELRTIRGVDGISVSQNSDDIIIANNSIKPQKVEITSQHLQSKQIILNTTPNNPELVLVETCIKFFYGHDYVINGNVLSWNGLGLEELLEVGEIIYIIF